MPDSLRHYRKAARMRAIAMFQRTVPDMTTPLGRNADQDKLNQLERIIEIMRQLRDPETGCPWDVEQDFSTIAPYTIEEAYEVADAVQRGNVDDIRDELGDLLLQVVFQARIAEEAGLFTLARSLLHISEPTRP